MLLSGKSLKHDFIRFVSATMVSQVVFSLYSMVDGLMVSIGVNEYAMSAVNLAIPFTNALFSIAVLFAVGSSTLIAIFIAQEKRREANALFSQNFATLLTLGAVITALVLLFLEPFAYLLGAAEITLDYVKQYILGIAPFSVCYLVSYNLEVLVKTDGYPRYALFTVIGGCLTNCVLDYIAIFHLDMGVFGAAFATVFSQAVAGIGSLIYIMRHYPELRWNKEEGRISAPHCAKLCAMGLPMGLQCSITAIGSVVLQGAVNGLGSDIVAAQTAGGKAAQFLSVPLESIGTAMTTYTSQNMGAKDLGRVNRGVNTALGIGCVYSVASFLILRVLDKPLIGLFLDAGETAIMANAQEFIFWNSVFYIPLAVLIIYRYTIQGLGFSGLAMFAGVAEMIARAMVGFWFVPLWGYFAACIASPVAWFFACFFLIPAYFVVFRRLQKEKQQEAAAKVQ